MPDEIPWLRVKDVFPMYGYGTASAAYNAVSAGSFPVTTYKLGRMLVIDKAVHAEFFKHHREVGLAALHAKRGTGHA